MKLDKIERINHAQQIYALYISCAAEREIDHVERQFRCSNFDFIETEHMRGCYAVYIRYNGLSRDIVNILNSIRRFWRVRIDRF